MRSRRLLRGMATRHDLTEALDALAITEGKAFDIVAVVNDPSRCVFCDVPVDRERAYRRVSGWEGKRIGGGANQITLREPAQEWACVGCVNRQRNGLAPGQQTFAA